MIYILSLMSEEQLKAFLEKVKADTSLQEKLKAAADADAVAAIAENSGYKISTKDIEKFINEAIASDGRGHFISYYDGNEYEENDLFIYRLN